MPHLLRFRSGCCCCVFRLRKKNEGRVVLTCHDDGVNRASLSVITDSIEEQKKRQEWKSANCFPPPTYRMWFGWQRYGRPPLPSAAYLPTHSLTRNRNKCLADNNRGGLYSKVIETYLCDGRGRGGGFTNPHTLTHCGVMCKWNHRMGCQRKTLRSSCDGTIW